MPKSEKELHDIKRLIDSMQSSLVEMFDQLRELRARLDLVSNSSPSEDIPAVVPLFSKVELTTKTLDSPEKPEITTESSPPEVVSEVIETPTTEPVEKAELEYETPGSVTATPHEDTSTQLTEAKISRVLDPISHELKTGEAPAEVIAEYLQAAKMELITNSNPNDKVAHDIDVVLKFLRARGSRAIRPEERDNILRRIDRWRTHLGAH